MTDSNLEPVKEENIVECRACLQEINSDSTYYNLFDCVGQQEQMRSTIAEKLSNIAHIEISEADELPKVICDMCCTLLQSAHSFAVTVRKTDELLRQKFANVQKESENVWPKPIQISNNIDTHYIPHTEIKEEVLSEDECFAKQDSDEYNISKVEIKVESSSQDCEPNIPKINEVCSLNDIQIEYLESEIDGMDGIVEPKEHEKIPETKGRCKKQSEKVHKILSFSEPKRGDKILEEMSTVQTHTVSEEQYASVNESEVCYPNYVTEQFLNEKESFSPEVVAGPSATFVKSSNIVQNQGEDQRSLAGNDNILTEIGDHNEDLTHNEQLSRNTNINSYGKNIEENFIEPITLTANTCEFRLPKSPAINLDINSDTTTNDNLTTPDSIANLAAQPSADSTNSNNAEYAQSTGSQTFKRGRKRKCNIDKKYIDYLSDEDFSTFMDCDGADSDEIVAFTDTEDEEFVDKNKRASKKKKNKVARKRLNENFTDIPEEVIGEEGLKKKRTNTKKERSLRIRTGQEYVRTNGKIILAKAVQPNPCTGKKCGNNCGTISEERRMSVFNHFWNNNAERRREWLASMTQKEDVKRKRSDTEIRSVSFKYHINEGEGKRPVCLQFLAATLNVSSKSIYKIVKNWGCAKEDLRGKHVPPNKTQPATIDSVRNFIKSLPAVPSRYCRRDSTKVYLTQDYKNVASIYKVYQKQCLENGVKFLSEKVFRNIFSDDFNIGFHIPKKDKCLKCLKFERSDAADVAIAKEKKDHEEEKYEIYNRFAAHKNIHKTDPSTLCVSFDLEKVLNTPHGESMLLYYSRKLEVYNLCFYENGTRKVFCYYWDESNGNIGANEIASILHRYIQSVDRKGNIKNLLLYCDRCPGQNGNKVVLAMLHSILQQCENLETIQVNYLLTGHTHMPVDSVHAVIENYLKKTIIYAPSQWYTVFSTARNDPSPYEVERLTYEDFYKWDSVADEYFKGNLLEKISEIRIATLKKSNFVKIKYSMNKSAKSHTVEVQSKTKGPVISCYRSRIPIATKKYNDLLKLCNDNVIPAQFHNEFTDIPHSTKGKIALPASDVDDIDSDYEHV